LCQITSKTIKDSYSVAIEDKHFTEGSLKQSSNTRPNRLFTADNRIVLYKIGHLNDEKVKEVTEKAIQILQG